MGFDEMVDVAVGDLEGLVVDIGDVEGVIVDDGLLEVLVVGDGGGEGLVREVGLNDRLFDSAVKLKLAIFATC